MKQLAAFAALVCVAAPSAAFDSLSQPSQGVTFYFSVPLDARTPKEQAFSAGFAIQGARRYETVYIDSRMLNNFIGGGIEAKWIIAGVVAAGAAVAVASKDKSTSTSYEQQQQQQQQQIQQQQAQGGGSGEPPCPVTPNCP
jgi:hypothetical protein